MRTRPISDVSTSSSPTWVETDKGDSSSRDTKAGWATPRRLFKTSTQYSSDPSPLVGATRSTAGFFPKLGRILEGSESKDPRRHRNSVAGVEQHQHQHHQQFTRRRRPAENAPLGRRPIRQKHGSLQRRVESLANLRNPSLISVLSDVTLQSNVSGGSNESSETITQQSYDQAQLAKHKPTRIKKAPQNKGNMPQDGSTTTEAQPAAVFRYMDESLSPEQPQNDEANTARPSTASSSSTASHDPDDDDASSNEENDDPVVESPMTSPASERKPHHDDSCDDSDSVSDLSVREGSPVSNRQPSVSDDVEGSDDEEGGVDDDLQEGSSSSEYSEDEGSDNASATDEVAHQQQQAHHMAIERVPPPRLPSTSSSSRHGDRHTKRLRRQEQALNEHVLQAPQPQREYKKFVGGRSPPNFPPPPAMPMYDPYMHSGASPPAFYATQHAPPPAPPPPTGYYSPPHGPPIPFSPGYEHNLGTAPMGAPNAMVPAPLAHYPAQPPQYQPQPAGPHLTRSTVIGYELVADKLSEGSKSERRRSRGETIVPMYRKFEHLNHRILLHLQDEISELEEELRSLDECIAQYSPRDGAGLIQPASRRGDARLGIELPSRRTELLGRIYVKLGQYSMSFPCPSVSSVTERGMRLCCG